ncbi:unnamed protein product [Amoebophrya sp. A25]|nr:unnamed protein product [Amoebophrya sp. A25]|eukprot:GSA25T00018961001.1
MRLSSCGCKSTKDCLFTDAQGWKVDIAERLHLCHDGPKPPQEITLGSVKTEYKEFLASESYESISTTSADESEAMGSGPDTKHDDSADKQDRLPCCSCEASVPRKFSGVKSSAASNSGVRVLPWQIGRSKRAPAVPPREETKPSSCAWKLEEVKNPFPLDNIQLYRRVDREQKVENGRKPPMQGAQGETVRTITLQPKSTDRIDRYYREVFFKSAAVQFSDLGAQIFERSYDTGDRNMLVDLAAAYNLCSDSRPGSTTKFSDVLKYLFMGELAEWHDVHRISKDTKWYMSFAHKRFLHALWNLGFVLDSVEKVEDQSDLNLLRTASFVPSDHDVDDPRIVPVFFRLDVHEIELDAECCNKDKEVAPASDNTLVGMSGSVCVWKLQPSNPYPFPLVEVYSSEGASSDFDPSHSSAPVSAAGEEIQHFSHLVNLKRMWNLSSPPDHGPQSLILKGTVFGGETYLDLAATYGFCTPEKIELAQVLNFFVVGPALDGWNRIPTATASEYFSYAHRRLLHELWENGWELAAFQKASKILTVVTQNVENGDWKEKRYKEDPRLVPVVIHPQLASDALFRKLLEEECCEGEAYPFVDSQEAMPKHQPDSSPKEPPWYSKIPLPIVGQEEQQTGGSPQPDQPEPGEGEQPLHNRLRNLPDLPPLPRYPDRPCALKLQLRRTIDNPYSFPIVTRREDDGLVPQFKLGSLPDALWKETVTEHKSPDSFPRRFWKISFASGPGMYDEAAYSNQALDIFEKPSGTENPGVYVDLARAYGLCNDGANSRSEISEGDVLFSAVLQQLFVHPAGKRVYEIPAQRGNDNRGFLSFLHRRLLHNLWKKGYQIDGVKQDQEVGTLLQHIGPDAGDWFYYKMDPRIVPVTFDGQSSSFEIFRGQSDFDGLKCCGGKESIPI